jgi:hypothetical protein
LRVWEWGLGSLIGQLLETLLGLEKLPLQPGGGGVLVVGPVLHLLGEFRQVVLLYKAGLLKEGY